MPAGPRPGDPSEVAIAGPDRPARLAGPGRAGSPDKQEKALFIGPDITSQVGRERQRQMLAAASQRSVEA